MGIWDKTVERFFQRYGEKWFSRGECTLKPFLDLLYKGQKNIKLVTGEADPDLYNRKDVIEEMENLLNKKVTIEMIFHKTDNKERAIFELLKNNPLLIGLKEKYADYLKLYWQKRRSPVHFTVVDASHILIEDLHEAYKPRKIFIKYKTQLLGERWDKRFDKLKKAESEHISLDEIIKVKGKHIEH